MTQVLGSLSEAMAATVKTAGAGVVRVEGRKRMPASGIIWSGDGVVVTAHHVLQKDEGIQVGLPDGQTVTATLAGRDPTTDLAVLWVQASGLSPLPRAGSTPESLQVGHLVLALGRPGRSVQATLGIVSALGDNWRTALGGAIDRYLQTDVIMYPGFSGGPLVNASGQVAGLNTSALLRGISLTIPAGTVERVVETLLAHGHIRRGYLGVSTQPVRLPAGLAQQLGQETGLLLVAVEPDSPAEKDGLLLGDTIVTLAGSPVRHHDDLLALLSGDRVGQAVPVKIVRGGQVQELQVHVGQREG